MDLAFALQFPVHELSSYEALDLADGVRLPGASLTVGKQGGDATSPGPGDELLDEVVVDHIGRYVRAITAIDFER